MAGQQDDGRSAGAKRPVTVRIGDFRDALVRAATGSELPPFMLELLLGEFLAGVRQAAREEYEEDREKWEKERGTDAGHQ